MTYLKRKVIIINGNIETTKSIVMFQVKKNQKSQKGQNFLIVFLMNGLFPENLKNDED